MCGNAGQDGLKAPFRERYGREGSGLELMAFKWQIKKESDAADAGPTVAASAANNGKTTAALAKRAGADGQRQTLLGGGAASAPDTNRGKTLLGQ